MASALDGAVREILEIRRAARGGEGRLLRPRWPMIVLATAKGWTGPVVVDGKKVEGSFRAHQVPLSNPRKNPEHLALLESWMRSYRPEELFDARGGLRPELAALAPEGARRMGANPRANGGILLRDLVLPDYRGQGIEVPRPAASRRRTRASSGNGCGT
jgi:xylulose-5-phosphate/fructose-6-phosphate phosphoketolase